MAIYTLDNKLVRVPNINGVIAGNWPEETVIRKSNVIQPSYYTTLTEDVRYLCFVFDFLSNMGTYAGWYKASAEGGIGNYTHHNELGFRKKDWNKDATFFDRPISNLNLNITNRVKYVIDRVENKLMFYINGILKDEQDGILTAGYPSDTWFRIYPLGKYFDSYFDEEEITISNASMLYCSDLSDAEKYEGPASMIGPLASN